MYCEIQLNINFLFHMTVDHCAMCYAVMCWNSVHRHCRLGFNAVGLVTGRVSHPLKTPEHPLLSRVSRLAHIQLDSGREH